VDQPVNTGFSYGSDLQTKMKDGADEFLLFLQVFFNKYPELKQNDLHFTGESAAGKYLPLFAKAVLEFNDVSAEKINLQSTYIIDSFTAPVYHWTSAHVIPYALNILDDNNMKQIETLNQRCRQLLAGEDASTRFKRLNLAKITDEPCI